MKPPVVACFRWEVIGKTFGGKSVAVYTFWCPFCAVWHQHSAANGHRTAHCNNKSPFHEPGYILHCIGDLPPECLTKAGHQRNLTRAKQ